MLDIGMKLLPPEIRKMIESGTEVARSALKETLPRYKAELLAGIREANGDETKLLALIGKSAVTTSTKVMKAQMEIDGPMGAITAMLIMEGIYEHLVEGKEASPTEKPKTDEEATERLKSFNNSNGVLQ